MNCKQNQKINQVKESTLVVGINIGSTTQYARAFDWRGIELGKVFTFRTNEFRRDFYFLYSLGIR